MNQLTLDRPREDSSRQLNNTRRYAHRVFDQLWHTSYQRTQAYKWLAQKMDLPERDCHFSEFNLEQCYQAIRLVQEHRPQIADRDPSEKRFERRRREPSVQSN